MEGKKMKRYTRQLHIEEIGIQGQSRLLKSSVLVIGAGGLGSPLLYSLAGAGVGDITVADGDKVSFSNLNRQFLYEEKDIGRPKVLCACEKLNHFNSDICFTPMPDYVSADNIEGLLDGCELVFLAVDNMKTRFLVSDRCMDRDIPLINGGIDGFFGNVMMAEKNRTPCLRCIYGPIKNWSPRAGGIGAVASLIASCMANLGILYLLGLGNPIKGHMLVFDGLTLQLTAIEVKKMKTCGICNGVG